MSKILVTWGRRTAIGPNLPEEVRSLQQEFGSAKKAAEFACDIIFMLEGSAVCNAWSDKFYIVSYDKPQVRFDNATHDQWVTVEYVRPKPAEIWG